MKPFEKRIMIEPEETKSVLVSSDNKFQQVGKIIAVGYRPWYMFWKPRFLNVDDRVMFNVWGVDSVTYDDKDYYFVLEDSDFILCKL